VHARSLAFDKQRGSFQCPTKLLKRKIYGVKDSMNLDPGEENEDRIKSEGIDVKGIPFALTLEGSRTRRVTVPVPLPLINKPVVDLL